MCPIRPSPSLPLPSPFPGTQRAAHMWRSHFTSKPPCSNPPLFAGARIFLLTPSFIRGLGSFGGSLWTLQVVWKISRYVAALVWKFIRYSGNSAGSIKTNQAVWHSCVKRLSQITRNMKSPFLADSIYVPFCEIFVKFLSFQTLPPYMRLSNNSCSTVSNRFTAAGSI